MFFRKISTSEWVKVILRSRFHTKIGTIFKDFSRTFQGPHLIFKDELPFTLYKNAHSHSNVIGLEGLSCLLHQLLYIFQLTCLKLIVNYGPNKESYDSYSVLDNQKASYDTFSGHYIQSWRKFKDFSRPGRTKTTVRWLSGWGRNLVRTCKPLTNLSRTSTFLNFMSSVWVRNLARLFGQELLGFKQPNLIWCLSEGQVDKKIFLWKVWTQESFLLLWRLCELWRSTFTVFVW